MATDKSEMTTLSSILERLRVKKQDNEFRMTDKGFGFDKVKYYQPEDLKVIRTYRFEGESDPADSVILYVLEANDGKIGYSIDSYGAYSNYNDSRYDDFIRRIPKAEREESSIFD